MTKRYIQSEESIIVNVLNCTQESANAKSLMLSAQVDKNRTRTILVLTKIDKENYGKNLVNKFHNFIKNDKFPENRIFLVRNRTSKENDDENEIISLKQVQVNEQKYFQDHKDDLFEIPQSSKGSKQLIKRLVEMQKERILSILPNLKKINDKIFDLNAEKAKFEQCYYTKAIVGMSYGGY